MTEAFPAFDPNPKDPAAAQRARQVMQEQMQAAQKGGARQVFAVKGTARRRFAGDYSLSRGSYYSVCNDEYGNDRGTLVGELSAYRTPSIAGHLTVYDMLMPDQADLLHQYSDAPAGFAVEIRPTPDEPNPITIILQEANLISLDDPMKDVMIFMPLQVERLEVPNVLDLRQLEVQQWLARFLPDGNELLSMPNAWKIDFFAELLPSFLVADRGGSDITDSIGFFLRKSGVNGLVFPSARRDVKCEFLNGQLNDFTGWNFVDYRSSKELMADSRIDHSQWEDNLGQGVQCVLAPEDSEFAGSWRIEGLEAAMEEKLANKPYGVSEVVAIN
jgi:hypothetical protein